MLANRGLFPQISELSGEYIAKAAAMLPSAEEIKRVQEEFALRYPIRVLPSFEGRGGYAGINRDPFTGKDSHLIYVNPERQHGARNWALWHELGHAKRVEDGGEFTPNDHLTDEEYRNSPNEQHAEEFASQHADWDLWRNSQ
jgi:Zn-dependent peptidase ImmA (M78 family)